MTRMNLEQAEKREGWHFESPDYLCCDQCGYAITACEPPERPWSIGGQILTKGQYLTRLALMVQRHESTHPQHCRGKIYITPADGKTYERECRSRDVGPDGLCNFHRVISRVEIENSGTEVDGVQEGGNEMKGKILDCVQPLHQVQEVRLNGRYCLVGKCPFCGQRLLAGTLPWKELDGTFHNCKGKDPLAP